MKTFPKEATPVFDREGSRDTYQMKDPDSIPTSRKKENVKLVVAGIAIAALVGLVALYRNQVMGAVQTFQIWTEQAGALGAVVYAVVYAIATVAFLPGWIFTVGAGVIYGVLIGSIVVSVGSTLGATLAFLLARTLLRETIARKVEGKRFLSSHRRGHRGFGVGRSSS